MKIREHQLHYNSYISLEKRYLKWPCLNCRGIPTPCGPSRKRRTVSEKANYLQIHIFFLDDYDAYIVVSFVNATLVLSIGETVEEVTDTGFLGTAPTLACTQLGEDALLQVSGVDLRRNF